VKGVRILPKHPSVPGSLLFRLEWFDNSGTVHTMSDWIMQWFDSQWRQLRSPLYEESSGAIGWTKPWADIVFNPPQGPVPTLSAGALNVLMAETAEQFRINRNSFAARFREAMKSHEAILVFVPSRLGF